LLVRLDRYRPEPPAAEPELEEAEEGQLALFMELEEVVFSQPAPEPPPPRALPEPPLYRVRKLSFTALSLFEQCAYKYFVRYGLGMSERPVEGDGTGEMSGMEVGSAVHEALELIDLAAPTVPELDDEQIRGLVTAYSESELARRVAGLT